MGKAGAEDGAPFKAVGGVKGQNFKLGLYDRAFSPESDGFGFVKKFKVRFEKTDQTCTRKPYFRTQ